MRAVVLLGLSCIAEAIRQNALAEATDLLTAVFLIAAVMDITEFVYKLNKKRR